MAKPPPLDRPIAPQSGGRVRNAGIQRPFPVLTPQSYIPGGAGIYPGYPPMGGGSNFPVLSQSSYLPPPGTLEPPIMNFSGGPGMMPPPSPYPPMMPPTMPLQPPMHLPPPMPYPSQSMTMGPPSYYEPELPSYSRRRPVRVCRRSRRSRRRCRPVIHVIDSSSCDSSSSYSTISSCSRRRHRSCSHSRRRGTPQQQQQQQPIILLPMPVQQSAPALAAPVQNQLQQQQPQQIILPPIQVQQQGQYQPQQLALQGMPIQQQQLALPPISFQQQPLGLSPYQLNSTNLISSGHSSPLIIPSGQPMIQPSISMPQIANIGYPQQIHGGALQYVQGARQSSSPLQYMSAERRSTTAPQRVLVNSTNKRQLTSNKPVVRKTTSIRHLPQNDLKFGRRPFDWYEGEKKNKVINENVRAGHRRSTAVG